MTGAAGSNKLLVNFVTVLPPNNIQMLYLDSAAFPIMDKEGTVRTLKLEGFLTNLEITNLRRRKYNLDALHCRNTRDLQLIRNMGLQISL